MRLYLASSWKQEWMAKLVASWLRQAAHEVFLFCEHEPIGVWETGDSVFSRPPWVRATFRRDKGALDWAEGVVLLLPAGASSHLEAGYATGQGKPVWAVTVSSSDCRPEVMYRFLQGIFSISPKRYWLEAIQVWEENL